MPNDGQIMHFDITTPRPGPQQCSGQPLATIEGPSAGGNPVRGDAHMSGGAGGDSLQLHQAQGQPSSFNPVRERSVTPRRGGPLMMLRGGSSPPERDRALNIVQMRSQRQMPSNEQYWLECTENALRMQEQRFEEVAAS